MERQLAEMKKKSLLSYLRDLFGSKKREKPSIFHLNTEETELLKYRLRELMNQKKPYLQKGYHIKNMADDLRIPVHQLSAFINQVIGMSFTGYMNKHRIEYCLQLMMSEPGHTDLNQLAQLSGFNNRNSFTAAFKKFTGQKPFEYMKDKLPRSKA